jgi:ribosomal-protein-alanine N-acetyltransferase
MTTFESERLIFRRFSDADADAIAAMRSDAEFMRYIKPPETREASLSWMKMLSRHWETENFGFWAVVLKETGETIGWSGTWILHETIETEIGFAIAKPFWGQGFATEAARVALRYAFENKGARRVVSVSMPENAASRRVMEKLGMRFEKQRFFRSYNLDLVYYAMEKEEYARNPKTQTAKIYFGRFGRAG